MKTINVIPAMSRLTDATTSSMVTANDFLKSRVEDSRGDEGEALRIQAQHLNRLGFANSANVRLNSYLSDFRGTPELVKYYNEKYFPSVFLPYPALHRIINTLNLVINTPDQYLGSVPQSQVIGMNAFTFDEKDAMHPIELVFLFTKDFFDGAHLGAVDREKMNKWDELERYNPTRFASYVVEASYQCYPNRWMDLVEDISARWWASQNTYRILGRMGHVMETPVLHRVDYNELRDGHKNIAWSLANAFLFQNLVVAPKNAFLGGVSLEGRMHNDWIKKGPSPKRFTPDPDPLVIRAVHGGVLVIAAWGDEAQALNQINEELGI